MESNMISHGQEAVVDSNDDQGIGRSYECTFCKRGFDTAQALGGHMNIHRKDRVNKSTAKEEPRLLLYSHQIGPPPIIFSPDYTNFHPSNQHQHQHHHHHHLFSATSTSDDIPQPLYGNTYHFDRDYHQPMINQFLPLDDWHLSLRSGEDLEEAVVTQKQELDLELRLGYGSN